VLPAQRATHWWPRARKVSETLLQDVLLDLRWERVEDAFTEAIAGFGTPVCHGELHHGGRERFVASIGSLVAEELLTSIATKQEAGHGVQVDHVLVAGELDLDPVQSILSLDYQCKGGLPGRHGLTARAWGLEARHLDRAAFLRRHRALARAARRLVALAWPLTGAGGPAPRLLTRPGLDASMTAAYLPEEHVIEVWLDDHVAADLLDDRDGSDLAMTLLHELAHAATPWRVRPFEPDGRDRAALPYLAAMRELYDDEDPIDHVLVFGLAERQGAGATVGELRQAGLDHHGLAALNESLADLWAAELLDDLRGTTRLGLVAHARQDDQSAYRPGRAAMRELLGDTAPSVVATAVDPLGLLLAGMERRSSFDVVERVVRAINVPPTADELDGPRASLYGIVFERVAGAVTG
jgi:hypothetical protein